MGAEHGGRDDHRPSDGDVGGGVGRSGPDPVGGSASADPSTSDHVHDPALDPALASVFDAELADIDPESIEREERYASRRLSSIEAGRRKAGAAGAAMAGAMLALQEIYQGPLRDEIVAEIEAPGEPGDIDADGIEMSIGDVRVWAPPPPDRGDV